MRRLSLIPVSMLLMMSMGLTAQEQVAQNYQVSMSAIRFEQLTGYPLATAGKE